MDYGMQLGNYVREIQNRRQWLLRRLAECPEGALSHGVRNGKPYVCRDWRKGMNRHRIAITKDPLAQVGLARRAVLEEELRLLDRQEQVLDRAWRQCLELEGGDPLLFLQERYPWMDRRLLTLACDSEPERDAWEQAPYERSEYRPDQLTHRTSRGTLVRSKSEALIAERLYFHGLPLRYEQKIMSCGKILVPDFTIRRADGKIFYWEHQGLNWQEGYARRQREKMELYAAVGIVPWDNLILTYDNEKGWLDMRIVEGEIENKLLTLF